eukprot:TRINITY_DN14721_c0_g1_i1.p1 TRINITY_DN14721_c0_g1~~TRINITY_DN14721_c0_g1_i1.p1  ORF type:complete len:666 (+),score=152.44 TRINITY_DN14721_c0_g1_i1:109-2106(+)
MAQMKALNLANKKAEIEISTLERIGAELRPLIQKSFDVSVRHAVAEIRGNTKDYIQGELRKMLRQEVVSNITQVMKDQSSNLGTQIVTQLKEELGSSPFGLHGFDGMALKGGPGSINGEVPEADEITSKAPPSRMMVRSGKVPKGPKAKNRKSVLQQAMGTGWGKDTQNRQLTVVSNAEKDRVEDSTTPLIEDVASNSVDEAAVGVGTPEGYTKCAQSASDDKSDTMERQMSAGSIRAFEIVNSDAFQYTMGWVVLANAVLIGLQTDFSARHRGEDAPYYFQMMDIFFLVFFFGELSLRIRAEGRSFFFSEDMLWNMFDTVLVVMQIVEVLCILSFKAVVPSGIKAFRIVRMVRILRLLRIVRLIRLMRLFVELRVISGMLIQTTRSVCGALTMVGLLIFLAAVFLTEQVVMQLEGMDTSGTTVSLDSIDEHFGSLDRTMLSLYHSISGGSLWGNNTKELDSLGSPVIVPFFIIYIAFFTFAMANVITGIFVKTSIETAQSEQDEAIVQVIDSLFNKQDEFRNISFGEWKEMMAMPEMASLFRAINIDASEATLLFRLLDDDGDGALCYEEFINGALRLRGAAKSLELAVFIKESGNTSRWMCGKISSMEKKVLTLYDKMQDHDLGAGVMRSSSFNFDEQQQFENTEPSVMGVETTQDEDAPHDE